MVREQGNEYAQCLEIRQPDSSRMFVVNVYMPPVGNLNRRGIKECEARTSVENILDALPMGHCTVAVGDFNTRIGQASPAVGGHAFPRLAKDQHICARCDWFIHTCEQHDLYVLNGM